MKCPCVYCNQMKAGVVGGGIPGPGMIPGTAPDTPNSVEQSPRGAGGKRGGKAGTTQRKRKQAKPTPPGNMQGHMQPGAMHPVQVLLCFCWFMLSLNLYLTYLNIKSNRKLCMYVQHYYWKLQKSW